MRESESLIREGLRIEDLSKRIQAQNEYVARPTSMTSRSLTIDQPTVSS